MPFDLPSLDALGPRFVSTLPDPTIALVGEGGAFNPTAWASGFVSNATTLTAHLARNVIAEIGWPEIDLPALDELAAVALALLRGEISLDQAIAVALQAVDLLKAALPAVLADVSQAVVDVVSAVATALPLVGWLLQIALFVARGIKTALARVTPGAEDQPVAWSHGRDENEANDLLAVLRSRDWTAIWLPPTEDWSAITISFDPWGKESGWRFTPGGIFEPHRFAWVPGTAAAGGAFFEGPVWGFRANGTPSLPPEKCLTENKHCPKSSSTAAPTTTQALLYPSAATLAGLAWTFLQRPTGACCNVDLRAVETAWDEWQIQGSRFLDEIPDKDPRDKALRAMVRAALGYHGDLYAQHGLVVALQAKDALKAMRSQIKKLLGTIAVAYVPGNAPALKDQELKTRWLEMRKLLLKHPARYEVDLEMAAAADQADGDEWAKHTGSVPYAEALWHTRLTAAVDLAAPGLAPAGGGKRRALDGGPAPDSPRLPKVPGRRKPRGGAGVAIAVGAVVGASALALALRGR